MKLLFKSARIGMRLVGGIFSILLAIPIPLVVYHVAARHCISYPFAFAFLFALTALEIWILLCLRNEWKLHMLFQFRQGYCSVSIPPAFFKPFFREFTFDRDTTFGMAKGRIYLYSPDRPPESIVLPFPMSAEQMFFILVWLTSSMGLVRERFRSAYPIPHGNRRCRNTFRVGCELFTGRGLLSLL